MYMLTMCIHIMLTLINEGALYENTMYQNFALYCHLTKPCFCVGIIHITSLESGFHLLAFQSTVQIHKQNRTMEIKYVHVRGSQR